MSEDTNENIRVKFVPPVSDSDKKIDKNKWEDADLSIQDDKIIITSLDNEEEHKIEFSKITGLDKKINVGKLALGVERVLPIFFRTDEDGFVSLISSSNEKTIEIKKSILKKIISGLDIEFVCPFSKGGKILLEKQPVKGEIKIVDNRLQLISEWMGKKQIEEIDITKLDDFDLGEENGVRQGLRSLTIKYQKKGEGVISTLINGKNSEVSFLDTLIKSIKGIETEEEDIELDEKEFMLVQMMYASDVEAKGVIEMLEVDMNGLKEIVNNLVTKKILKVSDKDEFELTEIGTKYIVSQMKKNVGG